MASLDSSDSKLTWKKFPVSLASSASSNCLYLLSVPKLEYCDYLN